MNKALIAILVALVTALPAAARVTRCFSSASTGPLTLSVDSIDYRKDLTRVYGRLIGKPHTSQRIDAATLDTRNKANDIDGVDFKRYFQWEDEGTINVEIDFQPCKALKRHTIILSTPRGPATVTATRRK